MMTEKISLPRRRGFTCKQFFVAHDRCAMKVGTDGVLLGGWAPCEHAGRILDIGTGSGLVALMMTQRAPSDARIDAVDIDAGAAEQAGENFRASPWADRLRVFHQDITEFVSAHRGTGYDLIVSNPPYFAPAVACRDTARETARYTTTLDHARLLQAAAQLLVPGGRFSVVLPYDIGQDFAAQAGQSGWFLQSETAVSDKPDTPFHRVLLTLSRQACDTETQTMSIKTADGQYSDAFKLLIRGYYLKY